MGIVVQHPAFPLQLLAQRGEERDVSLAGLHLSLQLSWRGTAQLLTVAPSGNDLIGLGSNGFRSSACEVADLLYAWMS